MSASEPVGLSAGNGQFPLLFAQAAKDRGVKVVAVAMEGETNPEIRELVDVCEFVKVGQLGRMIKFFQKQSVTRCDGGKRDS